MFGFGRKKEPVKEWIVDDDKPLVTKPFGTPSDSIEKPAFQDIETEEQQTKYNTVLKHFEATEKYPITEKHGDPEEYVALNDFEKAWLTKECFLRYLRACDWAVDETIKRLTTSIAWRREFGIAGGDFEKVTSDLVKVENETGKQQVFGFDTGGRPCLILLNGRQNTKTSNRQIQHLIYMLETSIDFMPQGQDKLALCVDFKKYPEASLVEPKVPSVTVGKEVLRILQYHYPERLGRALFINIPFIVWGFLKICWPFVDSFTKQKCKFDEPFRLFIPPEQLALNYGGDVNFEYVHDDFWPAMVELRNQKRKTLMENYYKLGGGVGLSEIDLREGL
ncbi:hypothetical protein OGAPHI_002754 [Ogataea philodendri]|uniref:CRAL-TRIO domain-containing protein n=1 Tax=Ogataea philodendri TaxID=1378263 RepID=A0A9P8PCZ7_9ASCO|nr:uncharacterized protein OGAPHI_002754 [Ogataea philodendri]KAH3668999.1 hypothetical protein OGAPHI_002754 [Ogataea philodendri]